MAPLGVYQAEKLFRLRPQGGILAACLHHVKSIIEASIFPKGNITVEMFLNVCYTCLKV